ncbi:hypothetical protein [Algoriphagus zhangzhouensis]|uniref:Uncharacterized protein n=1 Tax=Algoriphagus zhangzhouensis TaxID=1073327 RepID=A0A1M7Z9K9_9BACT|nr:hypothetical protein [Algoriphagus zhangzhouensis]TDY47376.1 hypothetical protein A8938_1830 [Algoriphagus zhangzhouensis]SHO61575.1 hypothetical protein SAMN04488108_1432 [Algoriphagus zhangzhouensis]
MKKFFLIALPVALLFSCEQKETLPDTFPMKVAKAYGFENLDEVSSISYSWNVQRDSVNVFTRNWTWNIKENTVDYAGQDTSYSYSLAADSLPPADKGFINDKYWAMMPFQLAWDTGYTFETTENVSSPIHGTNTTKLTIVYGSGDGYTPGDAYDLYVDENYKLREWVFRRGNGAEGRPTTWENEQKVGPLTFITEHRNAEGNRTLWISDIEVK